MSSVHQTPGIWRQVNQIYARPPVSTEQILHPTKYKAGGDPILVSLPAGTSLIQEGWEVVMEDVFSEFLLRTYLETGLPRLQSIRAASGWGGDRFRLLKDDFGGRALGVSCGVRVGHGHRRREVFEAYIEFTAQTSQWERREDKGDILTWHRPGRSVLIRLEGENTLIGIAPDPKTLALIAKGFP